MSEASANIKYQALQLAAQHLGDAPDAVVKRATAYHTFLSGVAPATARQPADSAKGDTAATGTSGKGNTTAATPPKPPKNTANKPAPSAQKVGAAGAFPADETKAPGAKNDFASMCKKLRAVMQDSANGGKAEASRILAEDGNGAQSVRDLDPKLYDAVVEACENVLNPGAGEGEGDGGAADSDLGL